MMKLRVISLAIWGAGLIMLAVGLQIEKNQVSLIGAGLISIGWIGMVLPKNNHSQSKDEPK